MKIMPENYYFKDTDLRKMEKQKTKFFVSALILSASVTFFVLTFSGIDFDFVRKAFGQ